jgi:hypothetical protein
MIILLFANLLVKKIDLSDIWYMAAIELLFDTVAVTLLLGFVFL